MKVPTQRGSVALAKRIAALETKMYVQLSVEFLRRPFKWLFFSSRSTHR